MNISEHRATALCEDEDNSQRRKMFNNAFLKGCNSHSARTIYATCASKVKEMACWIELKLE